MNFRPLSAESYGVEQNPSFLATFFSSACNFGRNANRPKILAGQISKYTRDYPKKFSCIWDKYWRNHMGSMPLQIPIPISFKSAQGAYDNNSLRYLLKRLALFLSPHGTARSPPPNWPRTDVESPPKGLTPGSGELP